MKFSFPRLLIALLLVWGAAACSKESAEPESSFFVKAQKNESAWSALGSATYVKSTGEFHVFGEENISQGTKGYLRLGFRLVKGTLTLAQVQPAEWMALLGGDVVVDSYSTPASGSLPNLEITRLDTVQKIVEGRFDATLRRNAQWSQEGEALRFTNGSFRVEYQEVP